MSSATRSRARTAQVGRHVRAKRKHRAAGAVITSLLLIAIGVSVALIVSSPTKYRVTPTDTSELVKAMSSVPKTDVDGMDPIPRPAGTTRSFYQQRGRITTIMYVSKQALADEQQATVALLTAAGWKAPANLPPGRVSTLKDSYTGVYANRDTLLELAFTQIKDITAATYIVQSTK
ncbi:MAG: hypothetical protein QOK05_2769 [Chloroflexota bacterium]|jgi:hypothetical protein|nr:hypothetical protein [Chloroflexota bacterium]